MRLRYVVSVGLLLWAAASRLDAENGTAAHEWRHWGADKANSHYSAADQINRENVNQLRLAWKWDPEEVEKATGETSRGYKSTPLYAGGKFFTITGLNILVALDPATGKQLWSFDPKAYQMPRGGHGLGQRGVEYWSDGATERIILATGGLQLFSIDAKTGECDENFGEEGGWTDLSKNLGREYNRRDLGLNSPAIVCRDTIVVGSVVNDFGQTKDMPPGHVRGYDVRTGKMKWIFHTIPQAGEYGVETWEGDSWKYSGNTNVWSLMSADEELGYVYLPTGTPTNDHYGGHRLGDNLFAESIVCLKAETGERVWHFQAVHHGIWDYDFPCAPNLVDITVNGKKIKAVAAISKQGFTYVFDRATGEPVWPIEERPVPPSKIPGERAAPTQPFPTKPPAFESQGVTEADLIDFTPELKAEALKIASEYEIGPLFTPPIIAGHEGKKGLIQNPGMAGGANWPGTGFDPETGLLYVQSVTWPGMMALAETDPARSDMEYNRGVRGGSRIAGPQGLPLLKPPYGRITAIDLNKGEIAWQIPHGDGPRNHPAIKHLNLPPLGSHYYSGLAGNGTLVTKTLLFCNQSIAAAESGGEADTGVMRAYDKATGEIVWESKLETSPVGPIATFVHGGKQYLTFTAGGRGGKMELLAYALP
jgi:quinoprotein glucose dehydrogenase